MTNILKSLTYRVENPVRIQKFRTKSNNINWNQSKNLESLNELFSMIDELAMAELQYYYRRRNTRAWISGSTRFFGWVLGTIGLLFPLLAATQSEDFKGFASYGYVFLVAAGSFFALNSLFGGTAGHIRFVKTQLEIEKLITSSHLAWNDFLANSKEDNPNLESGFKLISEYASSLYAQTITETGTWGEDTLSSLEEFRKSLESTKSKKSKAT
ncbi:SLATT domain-containing protein [Roseibium album]|uniref:SLATT domain-containing protein n=1 Tax=Roseibium album TaxID=311410 RepID=UPI003BB20949